MTRISVITPVLNAGRTVERAIRSVLEQGCAELEYIIIDGGSTDGTLGVIAQYQDRIANLVSEPDRGIADAFNKGIALASGTLIGMINADDRYEPGAIAAVVNAYERDPKPCILHGDMTWVDDLGPTRLRPRLWPGAIYYDMPVFHPTCFVHRDVYARVGPFDTSYRYAMDYDFMLRARLAGVEFRYVDQPIASFHVGGAAISHARDTLREIYRSQRSHGLNPLVCGFTFLGKMTVNRIKALTGLRFRPRGKAAT